MFLKISIRSAMEEPAWRVSETNIVVRAREKKIKAQFQGLPVAIQTMGTRPRSFFKEWKTVSTITGLDEGLLERFYIILYTSNCRAEIILDTFQKFTHEMLALFNDVCFNTNCT